MKTSAFIKTAAIIYFASIPTVVALFSIYGAGIFTRQADVVQNWIWGYETIAAIVAAYFFWLQFQEAQKNTIIESTHRLIEYLESEDVRRARLQMFNYQIAGKDPRNFTKEEEADMERVCYTWDFASMQIVNERIDVELFLNEWKYSIAKCWVYLKPMIEKQRQTKGHPNRWHYFQQCGEECVKTMDWNEWHNGEL